MIPTAQLVSVLEKVGSFVEAGVRPLMSLGGLLLRVRVGAVMLYPRKVLLVSLLLLV
jgi:hypothetical protein